MVPPRRQPTSNCIPEQTVTNANVIMSVAVLATPAYTTVDNAVCGVTGDGGDAAEEPVAEELDLDIPFIPAFSGDGASRLNTEFQVLKWLGKGGFGDVIKVGNGYSRCCCMYKTRVCVDL